MASKNIDRYMIQHQLGRGGMATVHLAHDPHFKRDVAIKLLPRDLLHEATFKSLFTREAQTIAALEHPAIVPVYDFGEVDGQPYLVMRYMPGGSLSEKIGAGPLEIEQASDILNRLGSALDYAHSQGVVHRDLKPANILFDNFGNCYLADFGIARLAEASTTLTGTNAIIGTPAYMSPEQVHGDKVLDGRSDIYSLAIILFEMLTGKQPFEADTPAKVMMRHVLDPIPSIREVKPDLPLGSGRIFSTAMAKERKQRYTKAEQLSSEFENLISTPTKLNGQVDDTYVESVETIVEQPSGPESKTEIESLPTSPQMLPQTEAKPIRSRIQNPLRISAVAGLAIILLVGGGLLFNTFLNSQSSDGALPGDGKGLGETTAIPPTATSAPKLTLAINSSLGNEILARGTIRIGIHYRSGNWPFSVIDPEANIHTGFELELMKEIVYRMFPDTLEIEWVYTTVEDRLSLLQAGEIDLLARNTTHTVSREEFGLWTSNYFLDGMRLLAYRSDEYSELEDMKGGQVATLAGTTNELIISQAIEASGLDIGILAEEWDPAMISFESGDSDAFAGWWLALLDAKGREDSYEVIGRLLTGTLDGIEVGREPMAFGIPIGQSDFRDEVDGVLLQIIHDGIWQDLYDQWFPDPPPWTIDEMLFEPPVNR
jgi:serine/threonine protein kinase